jgi:ssDNA-binding Zn-finger/Zn-ribbon topoisomerase 1
MNTNVKGEYPAVPVGNKDCKTCYGQMIKRRVVNGITVKTICDCVRLLCPKCEKKKLKLKSKYDKKLFVCPRCGDIKIDFDEVKENV